MVKLSSLIIYVAALIAATAQADIYRWVDGDGNVHFTDTPPVDARATRVAVNVQAASPAAVPEAPSGTEAQVGNSIASAPAAATDKLADACQQARKDYYWLNHQLAVYVDAEGNFRARYRGDPYQGERTWLSDAERQAALAEVNARLTDHCANPEDQAALSQAAYEVQLAEACTIARAKMNAMLSKRSRTAEDEIDDQAAIVDRVCNPPA